MAYNDEGVRVSITDLDSQDGELQTIYLQSNPETLSRTYSAVYVAHTPIGFTGTHRNFVGNGDVEFPLDVWYYATNRREYEELVEAKNFITAIAYPSDAVDIKTNAPPRVLITWPNNFSMICRIESVSIKDELFDRTGENTMFTAVLNLFSVSDLRLDKKVIKTQGITNNVPSTLVEI